MISARIALFNVHSPINYPLHNPPLQIFPPPIFRYAPAKPFRGRLRGIQIAFCTENQFDSPCEDDSPLRKIAAPKFMIQAVIQLALLHGLVWLL
ncbi:hypothetical protein MIMGU_mgv1a017089mg [Erythranthe guttata]|uniref:Uncharacterized protein n=1 Tax=Erythranthe guttata TaxID=4155 RepID=A0A022R276_ERYGU|nr:hypothetical protein MIMGU_mgv1a017089mg [Erythranthe guttata]